MAVSTSGIRAGMAYIELLVNDKKALQGLNRFRNKLKAYGQSITAAGMGMMKAGMAILAPLAIGVKAFADFEQQMAFVSTMLGKDAPRYMDLYSQAIKDMAVASGESTATLANSLYDLLSAQVAATDALDVLNVATRAAIGGRTDVATATKGLIRVLKAYSLEARQAADVSDVLFRVVEKGVITYPELAEHIGTVAPSARAAGLSLEELAATIATVVAIEEPARAMTALRQAIFEAAESGEDFLSFIRRFKGADLTKIIEAGIPKRAALGVVILAQNLELLDKNLAAMADRAGAADRAYEKMANTLTRDFLRIAEAVKIAFAEIGDAISGNVKDATTRVLEIIAATTEWIKVNRGAILTALKLGIVLTATAAALLIVGKAFAAGAVAVGIFTKSMAAAAWMAANPLGGALIIGTGVIAGIVLVAKAIKWWREETEKASDAAGEMRVALAAQDAKLAESARRLDELRGVRKLNNAQMDEAERLIGKLEESYGAMGLAVDRSTGKIEGLTNAIEAQNEAIKKRRMAELEEVLAKGAVEFRRAAEDMAYYGELLPGGFQQFDKSKYREAIQRQTDIVKEMLEARRELKAMGGGMFADAVTAVMPEVGELARTDVEGGILGKGLGALGDLLAKGIGRGVDAAKAKLAEMGASAEAQQIALKAFADETIESLKTPAQQLREDLDQIEKARRAGMIGPAKARQASEAARWRADETNRTRLEAEQSLQDEIAGLELERMREGLAKKLAMLKLEREQEIRDAQEAGGIGIDLIKRKYDIEEDLARRGEAVRLAAGMVQGGFSGAELARQIGGGGGTVAERTAKATEQTAEEVKRNAATSKEIVQLLLKGTLRYG